MKEGDDGWRGGGREGVREGGREGVREGGREVCVEFCSPTS